MTQKNYTYYNQDLLKKENDEAIQDLTQSFKALVQLLSDKEQSIDSVLKNFFNDIYKLSVQLQNLQNRIDGLTSITNEAIENLKSIYFSIDMTEGQEKTFKAKTPAFLQYKIQVNDKHDNGTILLTTKLSKDINTELESIQIANFI